MFWLLQLVVFYRVDKKTSSRRSKLFFEIKFLFKPIKSDVRIYNRRSIGLAIIRVNYFTSEEGGMRDLLLMRRILLMAHPSPTQKLIDLPLK